MWWCVHRAKRKGQKKSLTITPKSDPNVAKPNTTTGGAHIKYQNLTCRCPTDRTVPRRGFSFFIEGVLAESFLWAKIRDLNFFRCPPRFIVTQTAKHAHGSPFSVL